MIRIAVYDNDKARIARLDSVFDFYAVNRNTEYDVSWFVGDEGLKRIEKYAANLHIALVSVHAKDSREFCRRLYRKNPNCRICYYDAGNRSSAEISNPLWFLDEETERQEKLAAADRIDSLFNGFKYFGNLLIFDTRQLLYIVPVEEVVYFQSDLKYVNIICRDGSTIRVYKKLDQVEPSLSSLFLRIHKSYIVNKSFVEKIDKASRMVILSSGEELPVSNSQYSRVLEEWAPRI